MLGWADLGHFANFDIQQATFNKIEGKSIETFANTQQKNERKTYFKSQSNITWSLISSSMLNFNTENRPTLISAVQSDLLNSSAKIKRFFIPCFLDFFCHCQIIPSFFLSIYIFWYFFDQSYCTVLTVNWISVAVDIVPIVLKYCRSVNPCTFHIT